MDLNQRRTQQISMLTPALRQLSGGDTNAFLDKPFESIGLDNLRIVNCLKEVGIFTVGELVKRTEHELLGIQNLGRQSLDIISKHVSDAGLTLGMKLPEPQIGDKHTLSVDPIHGNSELIGGEILTSGAVINFLNDKQANSFSGFAKPLAADDQEIASFHVKRLPIRTIAEGKIYPVYVSDEALAKLTKPENLQKLSNLEQAISVTAAIG